MASLESAMKTVHAKWLVLAALAISAGGCGDSTVASGTKAPPPPVSPDTSAASAPRPDRHVSDPADILSVLSVEHQVDIAAQRDGIVLSVGKDEGAAVGADEVMGQLDDRTLQMQMIKAKDDLRVSENNVKFKEAELKAKRAAYRRQQQLRENGLSSEADLEAAEFEANGAEYDLHGWEALVDSGQAEIRRIEIELDQTRLRAPFPGVVVRRYIREGEAVTKGDKCFRVSQLAPLQVHFLVPESSRQRPKRGAIVSLSPIEDENRILAARIIKIAPTVDPSSDSYDVVVQLTGTDIADLRPGMAVRVSWPTAGASHSKPQR